METGKPKIAILMAVYEPRMDWLREQLLSLDAQTYPNLILYVRDDCSPTVPFEDIEKCIRECIRAFPYTIARNEKNLGSNGTFELLTSEAEAEYFAYCDQDDIWLPEKLEILQREIEKTGALLVCSDMYVIDGEGKVRADSITKVRKHHRFLSGDGLAEYLLFSNFVTGCTMLILSQIAKESIPFCPFYVHDQYLALFSAEQGKVISVLCPLIYYRIHGENQTLEMAGVFDRASYEKQRIDIVIYRLSWLNKYFSCSEKLNVQITEGLKWAIARKKNWHHKGGIFTIIKNRRFSPITSVFELYGAWFPKRILLYFVNLKRNNRV